MTDINDINWSSWSLGNMLNCGELFRRRHIEKERYQSTPSAMRGSAVHKQAEVHFMRRIESSEGLDVAEAEDIAADEYERKWSYGARIHKDDLETHGSKEKIKAYFKDEAIKITDQHCTEFAPAINPVAVEKRVEVTPRGYDFTLVTEIDLVDVRTPGATSFKQAEEWREQGMPTVTVIRDGKTSKKAPSPHDADSGGKHGQQLTFESLGWLAETGEMPDIVSVDYFWLTEKRRQNSMKTLSSVRTKDDINALLHRVATAVEAAKKGVFMPAPADAWYCSEKWCPYYDDCRYVRKPVQLSVVV